jgi:adenosine/AMP kinase
MGNNRDLKKESIPVEQKNFVGIGKIIFETPGYPWNIPHTHFIVNKTPSGMFEATNLELILDSIDDSAEEAAKTLARLTANHVMEIMLRRRGHDELTEIMDTNVMEDYWREYRKIEVELSKTKSDLSHNMDRLWVNALKETLDENIKKIIFGIAKKEAEAVYDALRGKLPEAATLSIELRKKEAA